MVTALYRRYRPETFAEMIGQSQVTEPLMTALRTDRVNHAYLFSGPRGCGKTTSARILARCLNCAEGPTDAPCGECPSCIELSRGGGGSLDVVEIDAASHGGVDDARDLRERAIFAPARDRYKIFIIDEAHMVTSGGFNALLKIVEEPPEHVKFIFATTEPDKVLGTIRSRTHHYPFRLVPPAPMLEYVQQLCAEEGITVEPGVLALVVRAGGGSPRDTLSLLDQLMAGSEGTTIDYERAVALLGYTHGALLDEVVDAIGARDAAGAFAAADRVVQTGQDPRRFVEDLLERLRDLIVVAASSPAAAAAVLRGVPEDELARMAVQAAAFGSAELSRVADLVNQTLTEMTGATSPRLHLELMLARVLVPSADDSERGALARVEQLERRVAGGEFAAGRAATPEGDRVTESRSEASVPSGGERGPSGGRVATQERIETPVPLALGRVATQERIETPVPPVDREARAASAASADRPAAAGRPGHPQADPRRVARGARVTAAHQAHRVDGGPLGAGARVPHRRRRARARLREPERRAGPALGHRQPELGRTPAHRHPRGARGHGQVPPAGRRRQRHPQPRCERSCGAAAGECARCRRRIVQAQPAQPVDRPAPKTPAPKTAAPSVPAAPGVPTAPTVPAGPVDSWATVAIPRDPAPEAEAARETESRPRAATMIAER